MILLYERDLDILKIYLHTRMKFLDQGCQKLEHNRQKDRQTDRHTEQVSK